MKTRIVLTIAGLLLGVTGVTAQEKAQAPAATAKLQLAQCAFKVSGMTCDGCAANVRRGLLKVAGVHDAKVDAKTADVEVKYDAKKTNPEKIVAAFNKANSGYRAELPKPEPK